MKDRISGIRLQLLLAGMTLAVAIILTFDILTPHGTGAGIPYIGVVLASLWLPKKRDVIIVAAITTVFIILGSLFSPNSWGVPLEVRVSNRLLPIIAIWVAVALGLQRKQAEQALELANESLEQRIEERTADLVQANASLHQEVFERNRAQAKLEVLAEASAVLADTLNVEPALNKVADLVTSSYADWCIIHLTDESGKWLHPTVVSHREQARARNGWRLFQSCPLNLDEEWGPARVARTGQSTLHQDITEEISRSTQEGGGTWQYISQSLQLKSAMVVPLIARSRPMGTMTFAISDSEESYDTDNLRFAQELAERIALTLDNSNLFHQANQQRVSLKTILDSITDAVFSVDDQMYIRRANAYALQLMGLSEEAISGSQVERIIHLTDREGKSALDVEGAISKCILKAQELSIKDVWLRISEGRRLPVELTIAPEQTDGEEIQRAVVVLRDVTDRQERDELRDNIISLVSHELRTPLTTIKGFVSSLLQQDIEWDEQAKLDMIRTIDREADRLEGLIDSLLDISRLESGKIPLEMLEVSPASLVSASLASLKPYLAEYRITIDVPETLPHVLADPSRIEQVISNLMENASKYSPKGSTIKITASASLNAVTFSVADEGSGIPPQHHQKIFEKFTRISAADGEDHPPGTGLGLAICKAIVEAHSGKIWVNSVVGQGSVFHFTVPRYANKPATVETSFGNQYRAYS